MDTSGNIAYRLVRFYDEDMNTVTEVEGTRVHSMNRIGVIITQRYDSRYDTKHLIPWYRVLEVRWFGTDSIENGLH